jgi:hypothetical protein
MSELQEERIRRQRWIPYANIYHTPNPPRIGDTTPEVEPALRVEPVLGDPVRIPDKLWGRMLILDELDELLGAYTGLVGEGEALREELDEAEFHGVADESGGAT